MPEANEHRKGPLDRLHDVVAVIGALMAEFPQGSPAVKELEQHRKSIMGLVYGAVTDTLSLEKQEKTNLVLGAQHDVAETRILRALKILDEDVELAKLVRDGQVLQELRDSRG